MNSGKAPILKDEGHVRRTPRRKFGKHPLTWTSPKIPLKMGLSTGIKGRVFDGAESPGWDPDRAHRIVIPVMIYFSIPVYILFLILIFLFYSSLYL